MADLRGGARDVCPPSDPKFLHFHAVFGENWPNNRLASPLGVSAPSSGKFWIRHCSVLTPNVNGLAFQIQIAKFAESKDLYSKW